MFPTQKFLAALSILCLGAFSANAQTNDVSVPSSGYFNVRSFGASGDGKSLDTPAINKAIDACAESGGGTVYFPSGTYLSGSIHLRSNIHLLLDAGFTILGAPQEMDAYDETEPWDTLAYQDGGHCYFHNSLIWGENLTNVFITGHGIINGGGLVRSDKILDRMSNYSQWNATNFSLAKFVPTNMPPVRLGNKAIALKLCRNVVIRDVTILHGGHFAILVTGCYGLTVNNVTMDTNRDGIDIDCCKNTTVSDCRINSPNDDGLCPKSSYALGSNVVTENLTIVNCEVSGFKEGTMYDGTMQHTTNQTGRIKFGTEASGGFRNVTVANCTFRSCHGLALEEVDGGILENITINNITMIDVIDYPIYLTTGNRNRGGDVTGPSRMKNVFISNVIATGVSKMSGIQITGLPEQPIENVRLDNIWLEFNGGGRKTNAMRVPPEFADVRDRYPEPNRVGVMPSYGLYARHVKGLELANIHTTFLTNDFRPAIMCVDVKGLDIENFKAQVMPDILPAELEDVTDLNIRNSPGVDRRYF